MIWHEVQGALLLSTAILALFVAAELIHRFLDVPTERTRKLTHVGAGFAVLTVPWLFQSHWTVLALSLSFFGLLLGGKVTGLLGSIHRIERRSGGAYYYPFAVYLLYVVSAGDPWMFVVPMLVMALSDTAAALVGQRYGTQRYRVVDNHRTLEGSTSFFGLTFILLLVAFGLTGRGGWPDLLLITLVVAVLATAVEAVSVRGADNLFIPLAVWFMLQQMVGQPLEAMGTWTLGMAVVLSLCLLAGMFAKLSVSGLVLCFLVGSLAWGMGGLAWFLPLAALLAITALGRRLLPARRRELDLEALFPVTVTGLALLLLHASTGLEALYLPYVASMVGSALFALVAPAGRSGAVAMPAGASAAAVVWIVA
jgi:phytol kinase